MTESRGWWKCGIGNCAEWTFEAGPKESRRRREPGPVIKPACMMVHAHMCVGKVDVKSI